MQMLPARGSAPLTLCGVYPPLRKFNFPSFPLFLKKTPTKPSTSLSMSVSHRPGASRCALRPAGVGSGCRAPGAGGRQRSAGTRLCSALPSPPAACALKGLQEAFTFRKPTWECEAVHKNKKRKQKKPPKQNPKNSPLAFKLAKVIEQYRRWKAGLFCYSASIQACRTFQYWWANRLSLTARYYYYYFCIRNNLTLVCQLGLFGKESKSEHNGAKYRRTL